MGLIYNYTFLCTVKSVELESNTLPSCKQSEWLCSFDKRCIDIKTVCNGFADCNDGEDEDGEFCFNWTCPNGTWQCADGITCLLSKYVCESAPYQFKEFEPLYDCPLKSDETVELCKTWNCTEGRVKIPCRGIKTGEIHFGCLKNVFKKRICVSGENQCNIDLFMDVTEEHCPTWSCAAVGQFQCKKEMKCVESKYVCDGLVNCKTDHSDEDEELCRTWNCGSKRWKCPGENKCILKYYICNGIKTCQDGSDELNCEQWNCTKGRFNCNYDDI